VRVERRPEASATSARRGYGRGFDLGGSKDLAALSQLPRQWGIAGCALARSNALDDRAHSGYAIAIFGFMSSKSFIFYCRFRAFRSDPELLEPRDRRARSRPGGPGELFSWSHQTSSEQISRFL